ncbi:MAG TPA: Na+/H+ antiporter NhaA [Bacteroidales bacterium]|nr:Na+/H+ antiporter NhaA [Bacteroidales bacterium]
MILTKLYKEFFNSEKAGGLILIAMTILSLFLANSPWQHGYADFWNLKFGGHTTVHWINDGLMSIFFLLIGLELEREIYQGELSNLKKASLPIFGALGGMIIPAAIYLLLNFGTNTQSGSGIPMATDIAFAIGILSLLGKRVPGSLKIFLTAMAVIDDLGAIIIIAVAYSTSLSIINLLIALGIFCFLLILNRLKVHNLIPYLFGGVIMWYFMSISGIHPTLSGILLAFTIPFGDGSEKSPSYILQHILHKPVALIILPLFALANTGIKIESNLLNGLSQEYGLGIMAGLAIGKPLGIWLFSLIGVCIGMSSLPSDLNWKIIIGVGFLGGIGFTMSIFINNLAFDIPEIVNTAKIAIFIGSFVAGAIGLFWLKITLQKPNIVENNNNFIKG